MQECKYRLPCNWCDKYDRMCEAVLIEIELEKQKNNCYPYTLIPTVKSNKCEHDWHLVGTLTGTKSMYKTYICTKCGEEETHRTIKNDDGTFDVTVLTT